MHPQLPASSTGTARFLPLPAVDAGVAAARFLPLRTVDAGVAAGPAAARFLPLPAVDTGVEAGPAHHANVTSLTADVSKQSTYLPVAEGSLGLCRAAGVLSGTSPGVLAGLPATYQTCQQSICSRS